MKTNEEWIADPYGFKSSYTPNDYDDFFARHMSFDEADRPTPKEYMHAIIDYHYALTRVSELYEELKYRMEGLEK